MVRRHAKGGWEKPASPAGNRHCNRAPSDQGGRLGGPAGAIIAAVVLACGAARGGGGPENVLVVVNTRSAASLTVANHYVRLRNIPASNVVAIDYEGPRDSISGERFRREILTPVLTAIDRRRLGLQIDAVAYCPDFPWRIDLRGEYPADVKFSPQLKPLASLTGATFLWPYVQAKSPAVVSLESNWCVPPRSAEAALRNVARCVEDPPPITRALHGRDRWVAPGKRAAFGKPGRRYLMATALG
ncbi:MAG: hypothetical protein AAF805_06095, partial [Planctomycetota bacterium]